MGSKNKQTGPAPTMNQLASTSPQHQPRKWNNFYEPDSNLIYLIVSIFFFFIF